ncbi:MAG: SPFH domain-containing protein [Clostridia bacterium]|nr:SPFH domain-containing protein [Clostridia bacterium]
MGFFKKNPNEVHYVEGKKHWIDVIKNTGRADLLIWKQPEEDFNTNSRVVVMPGEVAIFVHKGRIEQILESGTHKLSTENYPFISRLPNQFSGGISTFNCVVYFVKCSDTKEILWGLPTPIQVRDPIHGVSTRLQVRGSYKVSISDPSKFLTDMIGGRLGELSEDGLKDYFSNQLQMNVRSLISQFVKNANAEVLGICEYQMEIAHLLSPYISQMFAPYGLKLINFSIAALDIPEDDPYRQKLESAYADHGSLRVLGEDWARLRSAEILEKLAENPGAGGVASMGAGMGMSMAAAPVFANLAQQMFGNSTVSFSPPSVSSGFEGTPPANDQVSNASARFGSLSAVSDEENDEATFQRKVRQLNFLRDSGAITSEQYNAKIQELMDRL